MCGIAGFWSDHPINYAEGTNLGLAMACAMRRRGPDFQNARVEAADGLVLAHARLSVIDLSDAANQPFVSSDGRSSIVYNGEVYNFEHIRKELIHAGHTFRTQSDTEVVLLACRHWGVSATARKLVGMFAFAYWDADQRELVLVRDPVGIKPLFYGRFGGTFLFSSTLSAMRQHPDFEGCISPEALAAYFRYSYVPAPLSIIANVYKLPPGHVLSVGQDGTQRLDCYWDARDAARRGLAEPFDASDAEIADAFDRLLRESIRGCLISDVSLGSFLSGGIDSSLVAALMQSEGLGRAKTFTVGFADARYDESSYARQVAAHLGCDHTEITCTTADAQAFIPDIPDCYDEPFADSSQIPTMLLSKITRQSVTVALSGDGGDELFGGYDRYFWMERLQRVKVLPAGIRSLLSHAARRLPRETLFPVLRALPKAGATLPRIDGWYHLARMLERGNDYGYLYRTTPMTVCTHRDCAILRHEAEPTSVLDDDALRQTIPDLIPWMQFVDQQTYLPDDILQKVDRASMAYSLEARVPFLDHRVVEFAWRVPARLKLRRGRGKILMRNLLARHLPSALIERPKRGFSIPLSDWLKDDLREWAEALLASADSDPLLNPDEVRKAWANFMTGQAEHTVTGIWALLIYIQWRNRFLSSGGPATATPL